MTAKRGGENARRENDGHENQDVKLHDLICTTSEGKLGLRASSDEIINASCTVLRASRRSKH